MENDLNRVIMDGVLFELYSDEGFLLDPTTGKHIRFSSFKHENGVYTVVLDTHSKEVIGVPGLYPDFDRTHSIITVDEYLFSRQYRKNAFYTDMVNALNYEENRKILILTPKHEARLFRNEKPVAKVALYDYEIWTDEMIMVSLENPKIVIRLDLLRHKAGTEKCFFYFDWMKNEVVPLDIHQSHYPASIVRIEIANKFLLDSVAIALKQEKPGTAYLNMYPFESYHHTEMISLSNTWVKSCIAYNKFMEIQAPRQDQSQEKSKGIHF